MKPPRIGRATSRRSPRTTLLVLGAHGQRLLRLPVGPSLLLAASGVLLVAAALPLLLCLCLRLAPAAAAATDLHQHHGQLVMRIAELQTQLPRLQHAHRQAERQLAQLGQRSGLAHVALPPPPPQDAAAATPNLAATLHAVQRQQAKLAATLDYFDLAQDVLARTPSVRPVGLAWLSSAFGRRRDPLLGHWVIHKGLDLAGHLGDPVSAPADGVVAYVGLRGGYGLTVVLDHGDGLQTHYAHLQSTNVVRGARVRRGERLAAMGSSGRSTGPHLHYEVRQMGEPQDPRPFILN